MKGANNTQRRIANYIQSLDPEQLNEWDLEQSLVIVPYIVRTGVINSTETGYVAGIGQDPNAVVDNYSYFSQILTGREAVYVE
ncbi:MAG: hypothetical protein ACRCXT_18695 [Paraclostridium sp.]